MSIDSLISACDSKMNKSFEYLSRELRGIRTGRATTALIDYLKVDYYGSPTDMRELAAISVPDSTQLLVKPFDPGAKAEIVRTIETADLGLNPRTDGDTVRISIPAPSSERRQQLVAQVRKLAEDAKVALRNDRRDTNKQIDVQVKDKDNSISEDDGKRAKSQVEDLTKKWSSDIDSLSQAKCKEVEEV